MSNANPKRQPMAKGQLGWELAEPPEWEVVQHSIQVSREREPGAWAALAACPAIEVYTDGSAPIRNPGGDSGFAAVFVGWDTPRAPDQPVLPPPHARIDVGGYIPARPTDPATSNNRAEIAGVLAALAGLHALGAASSPDLQVRIWSDSDYAIQGALGHQRRRKNTDLWPLVDRLMDEISAWAPNAVELIWVKGHAGNLYNEAADELSTRAAFNFDDPRYARYRAAQAASGQEMPGMAALARHGVIGSRAADPVATPGPAAPTLAVPPPAPSPPRTQPVDPAAWLTGADYTLVLYTHVDGGGEPGGARGPSSGRYQLWTKAGRGRQEQVTHPGQRILDEAEYLTLHAALSDILSHITAADQDPGRYTITIYSRRELVVKQLTGVYRVKAAALQTPYAEALALLQQFKTTELIWQRGHTIPALFHP